MDRAAPPVCVEPEQLSRLYPVCAEELSHSWNRNDPRWSKPQHHAPGNDDVIRLPGGGHAMITTPMPTLTHPKPSERYRVSVEEYRTFRRQGFLVVPGLVVPAEIEELCRHTEELMQGRLPEQ